MNRLIHRSARGKVLCEYCSLIFYKHFHCSSLDFPVHWEEKLYR